MTKTQIVNRNFSWRGPGINVRRKERLQLLIYFYKYIQGDHPQRSKEEIMTMSPQIEAIIKKMENFKKKQMVILELKSIIPAMKNSL